MRFGSRQIFDRSNVKLPPIASFSCLRILIHLADALSTGVEFGKPLKLVAIIGDGSTGNLRVVFTFQKLRKFSVAIGLLPHP